MRYLIISPDEILLQADHPYVILFDPSVLRIEKKWAVKWRSFDTQKQDVEFRTKTEAMQFAANIKARARLQSVSTMSDKEIREASEFWHSVL